jgi:hypothetical protein
MPYWLPHWRDAILCDFAREAARSCEHDWDPPSVVRDWLQTGDPALREAAQQAAEEAWGKLHAVPRRGDYEWYWQVNSVQIAAAEAAIWAADKNARGYLDRIVEVAARSAARPETSQNVRDERIASWRSALAEAREKQRAYNEEQLRLRRQGQVQLHG